MKLHKLLNLIFAVPLVGLVPTISSCGNGGGDVPPSPGPSESIIKITLISPKHFGYDSQTKQYNNDLIFQGNREFNSTTDVVELTVTDLQGNVEIYDPQPHCCWLEFNDFLADGKKFYATFGYRRSGYLYGIHNWTFNLQLHILFKQDGEVVDSSDTEMKGFQYTANL